MLVASRVRSLFAAAALLASFAIAPASADDARHALVFHGAKLPDAIRLIGEEFHRRMIADATVPREIVMPSSLPPMSYAEVVQYLKSFRLDYRMLQDGGLLWSSADALARSGGLMYDRLVRHATVDEKLGDAIRGSVPDGTIVLVSLQTHHVTVIGTQAAIDRAALLLDRFDGPVFGGVDAPNIVDTYTAKYKSPSALVRALGPLSNAGRGVGSGDGSDGPAIATDDASRIVVLSGPRDFVTVTKAKLAALDVAAVQGHFDVEIVSVTRDDAAQIGLQYGGRSLSGTFTNGSTTSVFANRLVPVNVTISDLVTRNRARVIARTAIRASNGAKSSLRAGERFPIPITDPTTGLPTIERENIGVNVDVTPQFFDGGVNIALHLEESELIGIVNGIYPRISQNIYDAPSIQLHPGETLVMAGLMKNTSTEAVQAVPGLSNIPLIGGFFRYKSTDRAETELVFTFTPHEDRF